MNLIQVSPGDAMWPVVSIFIRTTYSDHYGARLGHLPDTILALVDGQHRVLCAAGLRDGAAPFFSEYYLDDPIETIISRTAGKPVQRSEIAEVANLASRTPAATVQFMRQLILYGDTLGYNWAFFTATGRLEKILRRIQLPLIELGRAAADRVPNPELWGSYYETGPRVLAIGRDDLAPFLTRESSTDEFHGECVNG
jgi:hypothetical protein